MNCIVETLCCEGCDVVLAECEIIDRSSLTAYYWNGVGDDPNRVGLLCDSCYDDYVYYWENMWQEYWASQGR